MFEWVGKLKDEELALVAKMGVSFRQWGGEGMKEKTVFKTIFELTQWLRGGLQVKRGFLYLI